MTSLIQKIFFFFKVLFSKIKLRLGFFFFLLLLMVFQALAIPSSVIHDIQEKFNIYIKESRQLDSGIENLTYLCITDKDQRVIVRIYRDRSLDFTQLEATVLDQLSSNDFTRKFVVPMIKSKEKRNIHKIDNNIYCLFNYVKGEHPKDLSDNHLKNLVLFINKMHILGLKSWHIYKKREIDPNYFSIKQSLKKFYSKGIVKFEEYKNLLNIIKEFYDINHNYNIRTIIHYDVHKGNILLDGKGRVILLDFDDFIIGSPILDVAGMVRGLCFLGSNNREFNIELAKNIISHYDFASVGEKFSSNDFVIFLLADLVRICDAFLKKSNENTRKSFLDVYKHILEIQRKRNSLINELSIFNTKK